MSQSTSNNTRAFPTRVFDLYWGQSGSGKSTAARDAIIEMHKRTGKKARVVIGDGSMATYQPLIDRGIVESVEYAHRPWPEDVIGRLAEGHFPTDGDPLSPLVPPARQPTFKDIGMYVFEGASMMGSYMMGTAKGGLAQRAAEGEKLGMDAAIRIFNGELDKDGKLVDGPGTWSGGNSIPHYQFAQRTIEDAVQRSKGLAPYVIWTAHESMNDPEKDKFVKEQIAGPEVVGKALIAKFQRVFNSCLHFQTVAKRQTSTDKDQFTGRTAQELDLDYRIWTRDHFSPDSSVLIRYRAVVRGIDEQDLKPFYNDIRTFYHELIGAQNIALDKLLAD